VFNKENSDEQHLARRLRNGENGAMEVFYSLYAPTLKTICSRYISDNEDAKDVFQNALVRIITHIVGFKYRGEGSLRAWASKIVMNEALRYLRDKNRHELAALDNDVADVAEEDDPPIENIPAEEILQMIKQLPTGYRTVFNLYVFENKSHEEIAHLLGIKTNTSASQLCKAKNKLATMIRNYNTKNTSR
jgi:RNA polymerase sigma-70 factor (ECF subfamily)